MGTPSTPLKDDIVELYCELLAACGYGAGGYGDEGNEDLPRLARSSEFPFVSGLETTCHREIKTT